MADRDERWIIVKNWSKFQHYSDRPLVWIRVYTELNSDPNWLGLGLSQRGLLVTLWCEFARAKGQLALSQVRAITGLRNPYQSLKPLVDAGFIDIVASKPLALARRGEERREDSPKGSHREPVDKSLQKRAARSAKRTGWRFVRGSHGSTYVPDENGTDRPPWT